MCTLTCESALVKTINVKPKVLTLSLYTFQHGHRVKFHITHVLQLSVLSNSAIQSVTNRERRATDVSKCLICIYLCCSLQDNHKLIHV